ncbi:MBL fold metallo-hydrolase [Brevundimonas sp.]|uniref:MBL fold metallo-hydrolase n=1 Tax=Brevundimonas sp. TaxID=1871086 RepID=UPI002D23F927|nr:MBL fold metallo-hydrolase [Brevundimonas sp.]HYC68194.1 MBL fold metallo-hydrolase [Brevundimonas sp.]
MNPTVQAFFDDATNTVTYLVSDPATRAAAIIDPVLDYDAGSGRATTESADAVLAEARARGLEVVWLLETHAHADHLSAGNYLRELTGAPIGVGDRIVETQKTFAERFGMATPPLTVFDQLFEDGDRFRLGELEVEVLHTPGHTPACVSYRIGDAVFVGDTLFMPDFGTARADFPGGDATTLYRSIQRLLSLPPETRVFVGHDYLPKDGRGDFCWETTVAAEREGNVHVGGGATEAAFVAMRQARDATLPPPKLLEPALRANIRAGAMN